MKKILLAFLLISTIGYAQTYTGTYKTGKLELHTPTRATDTINQIIVRDSLTKMTKIISRKDFLKGVNQGAANTPTLQAVTTVGATTTTPITADSFIKSGGTGTNVLLDNGTTATVDSLTTIPTLQQVTTAGATTTVPTTFATTDPNYEDINSITATNDNGTGVFAYSNTGVGVSTHSDYGTGLYANSIYGAGVDAYSANGTGVNALSNAGKAGVFGISPLNTSNIVVFQKNYVNQAFITHDGKLTANGATLSTSPTTSAGGYEVLTRNTTTGIVEKKASNTLIGATPTLQQVTTAGATTNKTINITLNPGNDSGVEALVVQQSDFDTSSGGPQWGTVTGINKNINSNSGGYEGTGVYGEGSVGVRGIGVENANYAGVGVLGYTDEISGYGVYGSNPNGTGVVAYTDNYIALRAYADTGKAGVFGIATDNTSNIIEFQKNNANQAFITHDGKLTASGATLLTSPTASAGGYEVLTRNTTTGVVEKKASTFFQEALTNPITGTGTTNYIPKFTSGSALGNSLMTDNGFQVSFGTLEALSMTSNSYSGILSGHGAIIFSTNHLNVGIGVDEKMRLNNSGNLLINTTVDNGVDKLQVNGSVLTTKVNATVSAGTALSIIGTGYFGANDLTGGYELGLSYNQPGNRQLFIKNSQSNIGHRFTDNSIDAYDFNLNTPTKLHLDSGMMGVTVGWTGTTGMLTVSNHTSGDPTKILLNLTGTNSQTGDYFIAQDISANPIFKINGSERILIGTSTDNGVDKLQVNGSLIATSIKKSGDTDANVLLAGGGVTPLSNLTIIPNLQAVTDVNAYTTNQITAPTLYTNGGGISLGHTAGVPSTGNTTTLVGDINKLTVFSNNGGLAVNNKSFEIDLSSLNDVRKTYTVPNASGTLSLTSDLVGKYVTESAQTGIVFFNNPRANYGDIGIDAVDFSYSSAASLVMGATGESSFATGIDNISSGYNSTTNGYNNDNASVIGFGAGAKNTQSGYVNSTFGTGHSVAGTNITVVGQASNIITQNTATFNEATSPVFVVGNGTVTDASDYVVATRSDALIVRKNGVIEAPSQSIAEIDAGVAKTVPTKEWVETQRPYKVYTALLSQSSTDAPVATVLENTLGGTVVWTRTSAGIYLATLSAAFTTNKTFIMMNTGHAVNGFEGASWVDSSNVQVVTYLSTPTYSDGRLSNNGGSIEIRVYN